VRGESRSAAKSASSSTTSSVVGEKYELAKTLEIETLFRRLFFAGALAPNRDNSPLSEWIAQLFVITVISAPERILVVFVREAKAL
jgi:hypothetical protein